MVELDGQGVAKTSCCVSVIFVLNMILVLVPSQVGTKYTGGASRISRDELEDTDPDRRLTQFHARPGSGHPNQARPVIV